MPDPEERDEFGVPLGEHTAKCGCRFEGRTLLEPCDAHHWGTKPGEFTVDGTVPFVYQIEGIHYCTAHGALYGNVPEGKTPVCGVCETVPAPPRGAPDA